MSGRIVHLKFCFFLVGISLVMSCSRPGGVIEQPGGPHTEDPLDTIPPVITISSPSINQEFANGASLTMTGTISDDKGLYRGTVKLTEDAGGTVLREQAYEIHGLLSYNFSLGYTVIVAAVTDCTVTVSFEDHGNNRVTRSVKCKLKP